MYRVDERILNSADGSNMGRRLRALFPKDQFCNGTGCHQRRSKPSGEMPAAPIVVAALIADKAGEIRVTGAGQIADGGIVLGMLIAVADHHAKGRAGGFALKHAGEHLYLIRFLPRGGQRAVSGGTAAEFCGDEVHVHGNAGRNILQHHADGRAVAFAKDGVIHDDTS